MTMKNASCGTPPIAHIIISRTGLDEKGFRLRVNSVRRMNAKGLQELDAAHPVLLLLLFCCHIACLTRYVCRCSRLVLAGNPSWGASDFTTLSMSTISASRLAAVRHLLSRGVGGRPLAALIVTSQDAHQSEYVSARDERRAWLSGFTGSAGTAVVTMDEALLWTDGRYHLQASRQLDGAWTLMKQRMPGVPEPEEWLAANLPRGSLVGIDPFLVSANDVRRWRAALTAAKKEQAIVPTAQNLVDAAWATEPAAPQPPPPASAVRPLGLEYAGVPAAEKIAALRRVMEARNAGAVVVSALDEVAWLFNIRGADVDFNPVVTAYGLVTQSSAALYIGGARVTPDVAAHLGASPAPGSASAAAATTIRPYGAILTDVAALAAEFAGAPSSASHADEPTRRIWMDPAKVVHPTSYIPNPQIGRAHV